MDQIKGYVKQYYKLILPRNTDIKTLFGNIKQLEY